MRSFAPSPDGPSPSASGISYHKDQVMASRGQFCRLFGPEDLALPQNMGYSDEGSKLRARNDNAITSTIAHTLATAWSTIGIVLSSPALSLHLFQKIRARRKQILASYLISTARVRRAALYTELSRFNKQRNPSLRAERKSNRQCSSA